MNNYLITYDISNNRKRNKVAKILNDYGCRVQKSVFELAEIKESVWEECFSRLKKHAKLAKGESIRIYKLCESCRNKIEQLGDGKKPMDVPQVYIF